MVNISPWCLRTTYDTSSQSQPAAERATDNNSSPAYKTTEGRQHARGKRAQEVIAHGAGAPLPFLSCAIIVTVTSTNTERVLRSRADKTDFSEEL
jgi:hypothetical protein